jgi:hypothetical protein
LGILGLAVISGKVRIPRAQNNIWSGKVGTLPEIVAIDI